MEALSTSLLLVVVAMALGMQSQGSLLAMLIIPVILIFVLKWVRMYLTDKLQRRLVRRVWVAIRERHMRGLHALQMLFKHMGSAEV